MCNLLTANLPATKTSPVNAVGFAPTGPGRSVAIIDQKKTIGEYAVTEFRADGGRAFQFTKLEGGTDAEATGYAVFVAAAGEHDSCECRGFLRHGHCKHLDTARAIADRTAPSAPAAKKPVLTARDREMGDQHSW